MSSKFLQNLVASLLIALIFLCLSWELWLAPLHPNGSWLVIKAFILLTPLFGVLRGKRYTYKWLTLLLQFYFLEGVVRATSDQGPSRYLAILEILLVVALFAATIITLRKNAKKINPNIIS